MSFINNTERNQPKIPRVNVPKMQQPFPRSESLIFNCVHTYVRSYFHIYIYFLLFLLYDVSMDYTYTYIYIIAPIAEQPTDPYVFVFSFTVKATQRYSIRDRYEFQRGVLWERRAERWWFDVRCSSDTGETRNLWSGEIVWI